MKDFSIKALAACGFLLAFGLSTAEVANAFDDHDHAAHKHGAPLQGGKVVMTKAYHFEVVATKTGLKVYPRTHEDTPIDASKLSGVVTFYHPNSPKPWFDRKLTPSAPASAGKPVSSIEVAIDLGNVPASGAKVEIKVNGLPDPSETTASFSSPLAFAASREITVVAATAADQAAINSQKVCAVSHEQLGSMGVPLKVSRGDQSVLLCCKGCLKELQANPDKFFGATASADAAKKK